MTVSLAYEPTLSRVRLRADGLALADYATVERSTDQIVWKTVRGGARAELTTYVDTIDTFTRSVSNGWGTADTGEAWTIEGGSTAHFGVDGAKAWHDAQFEATTKRSLMAGPADGEALFTVSTPEVSSGEAAQSNLIVREDGTNNNFLVFRILFFPDTSLELRISIRQAGVETTLANPGGSQGTYGAGTQVHCRCRWQGAYLAMKVWTGANPEPVDWQVDVTDATFLSAGRMGFRSSLGTNWAAWTGTVPLRISYHDFAAGAIGVRLDDYEFVSGWPNHYRVRGHYDTVTALLPATSAVHADNASVTPTLPLLTVPADVILVLAAIRNSGAGTPDTPTGYTLLGNAENLRLFGKVHDGTETDPLVSFTGGVLGATTSAQVCVLRGLSLDLGTAVATQLNSSAVDIDYPALVVGADGLTVLYAGWRQDDWASGGVDVTAPTGFVEIGEARTVTGDDQGITWGFRVQGARQSIPAGFLDVGAGGPAISRAMLLGLAPLAFLNEQAASITPSLTEVWLKSIYRSFLNRPCVVLWPSGADIERPSRGAAFDVASRSLPIGVTELAGSRRLSIFVRTETPEDTQTLDYVIASGDIIYLHTPYGCPIPTLYARMDSSNARRTRPRGQAWITEIPLVEVAAPGPDVITATSTWASILAAFPTWQAVLDAFPTWADVLDYIGDPSEVIVP